MSDAALEELISSRGLRPAVAAEPVPPPPAPGTNELPTVPPSAFTGKELVVNIPGKQKALPEELRDTQPAATSLPFRLRAGVDASNLDSDFVARTRKLYELMPSEIRDQAEVADAVRSRERQAKYHAEYLAGTGGLAAAPGKSRHDPGRREAIDLSHRGPTVAWLWSKEGKAALAEAGLEMPFANDRVHLQKAGGATTPEQAAALAGGLDDLIEKRGLKPANTVDGRVQISDDAKAPFSRSVGQRLTDIGTMIGEDAMSAGALMAGIAKGAVEVPLGIAQATLPRSVMEPVEEQYRNLTSSINNLGDEHPVADFAGKIVGSTGAILLGSRLLGQGASAVGLQAITPKLAEAAWRAIGPLGRGTAVGAGLGATQFYKDGTENEDRFGFNARMFDAVVGGAFGLAAGTVARGVHYAATQLSDIAFGRQFLPVLQKTAGDVSRNSERPLREAVDHYKRVETQASAKYGLTAASGRTFDGFPSGVGATQTGASEGFDQAIDRALASSRAAGVETRRAVESAATRARSLLGLDKERGRLAEWEAAQKAYNENLAAYQKAASAHPLAGAFQRNPGLEEQLRATGSLPLRPEPPAPFVPTPVSAAAYQQTRTMLNKAARSTRDNAAKTQIGMMMRELDASAAATATEFGMTGPEFLRRAVSANKFYEETVAPLRRLFDGKMARDVEGRATVALDGVTPAQFYDKIGRAIDANDLTLVKDIAKTLGPRGRDNMKMIAASRALDKVQDGEIGQAYKYIQQRQDVLRELLGRDEYTQLVGMGKVADDVVKRFTAGDGESRRRVFDWSHSFGPALSFYALFQGHYLKAAGIAAALPAYHFAMNVLDKIHTTPLMRPMIARAAQMRPGSKELSDFVDQMERRLRRATVPAVQAASPSQ